MENQFYNRVNELVDNGYEFRFGSYISEGFDILKSYLGGFVGFTAVYFVITGMIGSIPYIGSIVNVVVGPILMVGAYIVSHQIKTGANYEFGDFFSGFQRIKEIATTAIFMNLMYLLLLIPFGIALWASWEFLTDGTLGSIIDGTMIGFDFEIGFPYWSLLLLLPMFYLAIAYGFSLLFVVFYHAKPWEAMEASRKIITKKWFTIFLFVIVIGFLAMAGIILLFFGLLLTMPLAFTTVYTAFADVTNLVSDEEETDDLMDHLIA